MPPHCERNPAAVFLIFLPEEEVLPSTDIFIAKLFFRPADTALLASSLPTVESLVALLGKGRGEGPERVDRQSFVLSLTVGCRALVVQAVTERLKMLREQSSEALSRAPSSFDRITKLSRRT